MEIKWKLKQLLLGRLTHWNHILLETAIHLHQVFNDHLHLIDGKDVSESTRIGFDR